MSKVTPDMLKSKIVFDINDKRVGTIRDIIREQYEKIFVDFLKIEFDKKMSLGPRDYVNVRTSDAQLLVDGNVKVNFSKDQLKTMSKEQQIQKHPPTI